MQCSKTSSDGICNSNTISIWRIYNTTTIISPVPHKRSMHECNFFAPDNFTTGILLDSIPMEDSLEVQIELSKDYLKQDDWYPRRNKFGGDYFARPLLRPITGSSSINGHKKSDSRCKWGLLRHHCWRWWSLPQCAVKIWKRVQYNN